MAGDVTKEILHNIRHRLRDESRETFRTDAPWLNRLNGLQSDWMINYHTTYKIYEVSLDPTKDTYDLDQHLVTVIKLTVVDADGVKITTGLDSDLSLEKSENDSGELIHSVLFSSIVNIKTGYKLIVEGYIRPLAADKLSSTKDPIIGTQYHIKLEDAVLSDYADKYPHFKRLDVIEKEVSRLARNSRRFNRAYSYIKPFNLRL